MHWQQVFKLIQHLLTFYTYNCFNHDQSFAKLSLPGERTVSSAAVVNIVLIPGSNLYNINWKKMHYLLNTPPSSDALRHSGGDNLRWTSATVTLYFEVELSSERRPGTEQNTSVGALPARDEVIISCLPFSILGRIPAIKPMVIFTGEECAYDVVIKKS